MTLINIRFWQSIRKFLWAVWSVSIFLHMDKEETFLSWKLYIDMVWIFYAFSLDLKIWTKIFGKFSCFNFSDWKGINFCWVQMIYVHPLTLNYPQQYAKRLSNIVARYTAAMYTCVVWVISWAMWVYNTTEELLLLSCFWYKGCNIISDTLK